MTENHNPKLPERIKNIFIGKARNPSDSGLFHKLSLVAFLAWVGLGADGISSSCYGPQEAFLSLGSHTYLAVFVALATVVTIFIISTSYSQIVELFPAGGGGYIVASKLLSPVLGMISGCALLIDYVLTISISIASGTDAIFSFLPLDWQQYKFFVAALGILFLTLLNLRGVKESVVSLVPIFLVFIATHVFTILYVIVSNFFNLPVVLHGTVAETHATYTALGTSGLAILILRSYTMGAGTYTGIEAVSNGMNMLREPRVVTAKKTMSYMAVSLSLLAFGLMLAYLLLNVSHSAGKTLNAIVFEKMSTSWNPQIASIFILVTLISEAALLFVAAQTGFLGGPSVLANMAGDRWFPTKFSILSDRLVTHYGILLMSLAALATLALTKGSVSMLVVLYSINVFVTFVLSQAGMVRHWWNVRAQAPKWKKKIAINGIGFVLTCVILVSMIVIKFYQGAWVTLLITGTLIAASLLIKRHYIYTAKLLHRLNSLVAVVDAEIAKKKPIVTQPNRNGRTAVIFVNGYNGLGLHTLLNILRYFGDMFSNFIFVQIGVLDAGNFKSEEKVREVEASVQQDLAKYISYVQCQGHYAQGICRVGIDIVEEASSIAPQIIEQYPRAIFFGGQLVFRKNMLLARWLHNYTVFVVQKRFYDEGIPFFILPIRVY